MTYEWPLEKFLNTFHLPDSGVLSSWIHMLVWPSDNGTSQQNSSVSLRVISNSGARSKPTCRHDPDSGRFRMSLTENELIPSECNKLDWRCDTNETLTNAWYPTYTKEEPIQLPVSVDARICQISVVLFTWGGATHSSCEQTHDIV